MTADLDLEATSQTPFDIQLVDLNKEKKEFAVDCQNNLDGLSPC